MSFRLTTPLVERPNRGGSYHLICPSANNVTPPHVIAASTVNQISGYSRIFPPIQKPKVPMGGGGCSDGMEMVWHGEFSRFFSSFYPPHVWYLSVTNQAPQERWKTYRDSAKVRFCCQDCGNGWTSMKGRVSFWFYLDLYTNSGFVQFKLYGQQCKKCNSGKFEFVMWYPEEVAKVMHNLYIKVGQTHYGFYKTPIRIDRRPGKPRNQHNAELCQACKDGECDRIKVIDNASMVATAASAATSTNSKPPPTSSTGNGLSSPRPTVCNYYVSDSPTTKPSENSSKPRNKTCSEFSPIQRNPTTYQQASDSVQHFSTPVSTENNLFFYHPAPPYPLIPGGIAFPTHPMCPVVVGALPKPDAVATLTELMDATKLNNNKKGAETKTASLKGSEQSA